MTKDAITIAAEVSAPIATAWQCWTDPKHIVQWNFASDDWCSPRATNDLRVGGRFNSRMESRDGKIGFDFEGEYTEVVHHQRISYKMADSREVTVTFKDNGPKTVVTESFDPESENPKEMQQAGWQAILNNYKRHAEKTK